MIIFWYHFQRNMTKVRLCRCIIEYLFKVIKIIFSYPNFKTLSTMDCVYFWNKFKMKIGRKLAINTTTMNEQISHCCLRSYLVQWKLSWRLRMGTISSYSVRAVLSNKFSAPLYMSLCNLMFKDNNNNKNTVFQSIM